MKKALVTGAGGFIGHHLVNFLKKNGWTVIGVDLKHPEYEPSKADRFVIHDIRKETQAWLDLFEGVDRVWGLAADMGGMGFISKNHAMIMRNNVTINLNTLEAAARAKVKRYLYTSSACIYPQHLQTETDVVPLKESMAYPANPQDGYGWEKLYTEKLCRYYREERGLETRIVRFHNMYGPLGTWRGGREKAPAALCRKVAEAILTKKDPIELWGDGEQTRTFCYIDDCIKGLNLLMESGHSEPLNLGSDEIVTINELADLVMRIAGVK
ncbi:MAG: NAD-dependent epimerase/dehydratase family protein, partial [Candidatus Omnitrophica bacterium]|nr:NAD-dependent epimerase/dehydratase family protein [Candidatus Omnitrophota bacterium]